MVKTWKRTCPMETSVGSTYSEIWTFEDSSNDQSQDYKVNVRLGKHVDILSLKLNMIEDFDSQVSYNRSTRTSLFNSGETEKVNKCPICGSSARDSVFCLNIYGGLYHQCSICNHCFVVKRPTKKALKTFYSRDTYYAATYTDKRITETRIRQVAIPKAEWMIEQFELLYGRKPKSILDVGAGGGGILFMDVSSLAWRLRE